MELILENRAVLATLAGLLALLVLILRAKMNAFAALLLMAILTALLAGLAPDSAFGAVTRGMGGTLGFIAPVIGLGALFGVILEAGGGVEALARTAAQVGGAVRQRWVMGGLGLVAATPVFFDVALIILMPFILAAAARTGAKAMSLGLPLAAGLAAGHAFVPPTPGPIAIADLIGADLGWVILFGSLAGIISVAVAGPLLAGWLERMGLMPEGNVVFDSDAAKARAVPQIGFGRAAFLILLPLVLILVGTIGKLVLDVGTLKDTLAVIGHPFSALLIASGAAWLLLRPSNEQERTTMRSATERAFEPTGAVILITGAGGAFKQVLVDTGAGADLAAGVAAIGLTPILAGFALALLVRVAQGSATVAMITAAGLMAPILEPTALSAPQLGLVTIAIAAGATGFSHVNDSGFWLVQRLFGLNTAETLRTWTVSTGTIAFTGLIFCSIVWMLV